MTGFPDWEYLFKEFLRWKGSEKAVITTDEFPYLVELDGSITSQFQNGTDACLTGGTLR